ADVDAGLVLVMRGAGFGEFALAVGSEQGMHIGPAVLGSVEDEQRLVERGPQDRDAAAFEFLDLDVGVGAGTRGSDKQHQETYQISLMHGKSSLLKSTWGQAF